jgi:hypothetical protein
MSEEDKKEEREKARMGMQKLRKIRAEQINTIRNINRTLAMEDGAGPSRFSPLNSDDIVMDSGSDSGKLIQQIICSTFYSIN